MVGLSDLFFLLSFFPLATSGFEATLSAKFKVFVEIELITYKRYRNNMTRQYELNKAR